MTACFGLWFPEARPLMTGAMKQESWFVAAAIFLVSYVIGSVIRLYASDFVDSISAWCIRLVVHPFAGKAGSIQDHLAGLLDDVTNPAIACPSTREVAQWAWKYDRFPYPVWECMKMRLYHPPEMFAFYEAYRECFAAGPLRGKEFFNYCKSVIYSANEGKRHALAEEVQAAEANVRFFAGTFWAVVFSLLLLLATCAVLGFEKSPPKGALPGCVFAALLAVSAAGAIVAGGRFRGVRLKEVDTVFDAFYVVHRHAAQCPRCSRPAGSALYEERRDLVESAFSAGMSLQQLTDLMRLRSHDNPALSSIYFAGADRDHPYFLHSDRVAIGISVLPEDEPKSITAKKHPHQNEVIVVLDGELRVEAVTNGIWQHTDLVAGQVKVIAPGACHRIVAKGQARATFMFLKTDPAAEPREEICPGPIDG
jgi:mannose-6-phosphate isomerase-like protein (cupin superfamily)